MTGPLDGIAPFPNNSAADAHGLDDKESIGNRDPVRWILYDIYLAPLLLNHWIGSARW